MHFWLWQWLWWELLFMTLSKYILHVAARQIFEKHDHTPYLLKTLQWFPIGLGVKSTSQWLLRSSCFSPCCPSSCTWSHSPLILCAPLTLNLEGLRHTLSTFKAIAHVFLLLLLSSPLVFTCLLFLLFRSSLKTTLEDKLSFNWHIAVCLHASRHLPLFVI